MLINPRDHFVDQVTVAAELQAGNSLGFRFQVVRVYPYGADGLPDPNPRVQPLPHDAGISLLFKFLHDAMVHSMVPTEDKVNDERQ